MWEKDHRKSKKACVPRKKFEEEPEYYSFNDNYDYGDVDYEQDNDQFIIFLFFIYLMQIIILLFLYFLIQFYLITYMIN